MKKELEFDVKRMLNLLESKLGNVKTIIVEDSDIEDIEIREEDAGTDAMTKLTRVELNYKDMGCERTPAANDALLPGESANAWGTIGSKLSKIVDASGKSAFTSVVNADTKFVPMQCGNSMFMVTNVISPNDSNQLVVLKRNGEGANTTFQIGQKPFDGLLQRAKSYVSDERNLNAEQIMVLNNLLGKPGIKKTETTFTTDRSTGFESNDYEAVDLSTGKGVKTGTQYLDIGILKPDSLDQAFKTPNKYYVWAKRAIQAVGTDVVGDVEKMLSQIGFTADRNKLPDYQGPTDTRVTQATTLSQYCAGGKCDGYPDIIKYIQKFGGGDTPIYPKNASREEAQVALNVGKRATKKAMNKIAQEGANRKSCKAIISLFDQIIFGGMNDDNDIARVVTAAGYETNAGGVPDIMTQLGSVLGNCAESWRNVSLNKKDTNKLQQLISSSHKYAPNAAKVQQAAAKAEKEMEGNASSSPLGESISNSLRKVLKEHTKTNSNDMIKKSIRKNLRRLL